MKKLFPILLLTIASMLVSSCNSKSNNYIPTRVPSDNSTPGSNGGTFVPNNPWQPGTNYDPNNPWGDGQPEEKPDPQVDVPHVAYGCTAAGVPRADGAPERQYIQTTAVVTGKRANEDPVLFRFESPRLVTDSILRLRFVPLKPNRYEKDAYGNQCLEDSADTLNYYSKLQLAYRIKDGDGRVYQEGLFSPASIQSGASDCSDVVKIDPDGDLYNTVQKPFVIEITDARTDLQCRRSGGEGYGCNALMGLGTNVQYGSRFFPCAKFILQVETDYTVALPEKGNAP